MRARNEDTCPICGETIPEGRMICPQCEEKINESHKCHFPEGIEIKPDGIHKLDACVYEVIDECHAIVRVLRCKKCGHEEIEWERL